MIDYYARLYVRVLVLAFTLYDAGVADDVAETL